MPRRRYSKKSQEKVEKAMREYKHGQLKIGKAKKKVKNPKQAIAIGLSEARRSGAKVPPLRSEVLRVKLAQARDRIIKCKL